MKSIKSPSFVRFLVFTIVTSLLLPLTNSEISAAIKITPAAVTPPSNNHYFWFYHSAHWSGGLQNLVHINLDIIME
ncbi:MAG: hypothetical protein WBQ25_12420 [Nitrososphaeraceae archaeon]